MKISKNAPNDLFENKVFWNINIDGANWIRFDATMEEAKNILAERGSVCIQLKLQNMVSDYSILFLSLLLDKAAERAMTNIQEDDSMQDVNVISESYETYNSNNDKVFMLCLYLDKNELIIN